MMYLKAIASAAAGFVLARLLVAVGAAFMGGATIGFELVALQAIAWVAMASLVSYGWTELEKRRAASPTLSESTERQLVQV